MDNGVVIRKIIDGWNNTSTWNDFWNYIANIDIDTNTDFLSCYNVYDVISNSAVNIEKYYIDELEISESQINSWYSNMTLISGVSESDNKKYLLLLRYPQVLLKWKLKYPESNFDILPR